MNHVVFWVFQVIGICGAMFALWLTVAAAYQPVVAFDSGGSVLAQSDIRFYQSSSVAPDPMAIHDRINELRQERGLKPLAANATLSKVAQARAFDMAEVAYYAHENPLNGNTFVTDMRKLDVSYSFACENLNMSFTPHEERVINAWLQSVAGHRDCLLSDRIGFAGYASTEIELIDGHVSYVVVAVYSTL